MNATLVQYVKGETRIHWLVKEVELPFVPVKGQLLLGRPDDPGLQGSFFTYEVRVSVYDPVSAALYVYLDNWSDPRDYDDEISEEGMAEIEESGWKLVGEAVYTQPVWIALEDGLYDEDRADGTGITWKQEQEQEQ